MAFQQMPAEVLEYIFKCLDGRSFCIAKQVCKSWHEVVKQMQGSRLIWKKFCLDEIPSYILEDILAFKNVPLNDPIINWIAVYKKWFQGKLIISAPYWRKLVQAFCSNPVTCVKLSGSWVITGHSNGLLCIWNRYSGEILQKCPCHLKAITDIAMVDLLNLGAYYGSEELPWAHHHAITVSKDSYIQVKPLLESISVLSSSLVLSYHSDVLEKVRVFGKYFAVSCRDNTVTLWSMEVVKKPHFDLQVSLLRSIIGPADILMSLGYWHNEIHCISYAGRLKVFVPDKELWMEQKYFKNSYSEKSCERVVSVTAAYIFRNQTVIMLTTDGKMIVSINDHHSQHYFLMQTLQTVLVTVALYGTMLALGGENGRLYLFHVPDVTHLLNLDLSNPTFTLTLSEASIISIDILYDEESPIIVAATTESIFIVKWYKSESSHQEVKLREVSHLFTSG